MNLQQALNGEFSFYKDSKMAMDHYHEYGFHIEHNFFSSQYCDNVVKEAHNLSAAREGNFRPALMPHKENEFFLEAMKHDKTVEILKKLFNGIPVGMQTQFFYCKPGTRGFSLHQDNFYIEANYGVFISVWVALVDTSISNGGLFAYPGAHKEGHLPVRKLNYDLTAMQDKNANNEETVVPEKYQAYDLTLPKGSALFIHAHLPHGSHSNTSDHARYSLLNLYIKEGENFRSGNSAKRHAIPLI